MISRSSNASNTKAAALLAFVLPLALGIDISLVAGQDASSSSIQVTGSDIHVITDDERSTYGLNDANVKSAVEKYFGKKPDDAYLHSVTPWNDLYKTYGWKQVTVTFKSTKAQILSLSSQPIILANKTLENDSKHKATFRADITDSVTNTVQNGWSTTEQIKIGQKFSYKVGFLGTGAGGETSLEYTQSFGQSGSQSKSTTVGSSEGVTVDLGPGQKVLAELEASRGALKARIWYEVSISGDIAINYGGSYKGHHFWALDANQVMNSVGNTLTKTVTEDIECAYYGGGHVKLVDGASSLLRGSSHVPEIKLAKFADPKPGMGYPGFL